MNTIVKKWKCEGSRTAPGPFLSQNCSEDLREGAALIARGGLVAFPTETVYGLGGNAFDPEASRKIYAAKGRPSDNPLIVHISDLSELDGIVRAIPPVAQKLADAFWPGPLTMIFEKTDRVPKETTGGLETVAVRMPAHAAALELIRLSGVPIAASSANLSGHPSPTGAEHVMRDLSGRPHMIIDGGSCDIGVESTIIDLTAEIPMILRPGYITKEMLEEVIGSVMLDPAIAALENLSEGSLSKQNAGLDQTPDNSEKNFGLDSVPSDPSAAGLHPKAPGMKYRHYAPKAPFTLVSSENPSEDPLGRRQAEKILELAEEALADGKCVGLIGTVENETIYQGFLASHGQDQSRIVLSFIGSRRDPAGIARGLYGILREFDETNVDCIFGESFETDHLGEAIMNRLLKAAGRHVVSVE